MTLVNSASLKQVIAHFSLSVTSLVDICLHFYIQYGRQDEIWDRVDSTSNFRLPPRIRWDLRSSVMLRNVVIIPYPTFGIIYRSHFQVICFVVSGSNLGPPSGYPNWRFWFTELPQANGGIIPQNRPQPLPSIFLWYNTITFPLFDTRYSELLTLLFHKLSIG